MNNTLDLELVPLDAIEAPLSNAEGIALVIGALGAGLIIGSLIT